MSDTTTPKNIDDNIKKFADSISQNSNSELIFIDITPCEGAKPGNCFYNVQDKVNADGGEIQYGWIIWKWANIMLEAEFHSVWRNKEGNLIDITPTADNEKQILFISDNVTKFEDKVVNNIRYPLINSPKMDEYINIATKITELRNKGRNEISNGLSNSVLRSTYGQELIKLSQRLSTLKFELEHLTEKVGRNDKCPCGSGKKYKKCCESNEA